MERFNHLSTEKIDHQVPYLENITTYEYIGLASNQHNEIYSAINEEKEKLTSLIDAAYACYERGGNIIYVGTGISGKIAQLDCDNYESVFGVDNQRFQAVTPSTEKTNSDLYEIEDRESVGKEDAKLAQISNKDFVIAVSASGRTPYVLGAINYANQINALTACVCCNKQTALGGMVEYPVEIQCGSELILGFTKMKCASAEKTILNTISTGILIKAGKTYKNYTPFLKASGEKQRYRAITTIAGICDIDESIAKEYYEKSDNNIPAAILMIKYNIGLSEAKKHIDCKKSAHHIIDGYLI